MALNYRITKSEQVTFPPSVTSGEFGLCFFFLLVFCVCFLFLKEKPTL